MRTTLCAGVARRTFAHGLRAHPLDERFDDPEVDVRFEQRETNPKRGVDMGFIRRSSAATEEDVLQTVFERVQHTVHYARSGQPARAIARAFVALTGSSANSYVKRRSRKAAIGNLPPDLKVRPPQSEAGSLDPAALFDDQVNLYVELAEVLVGGPAGDDWLTGWHTARS